MNFNNRRGLILQIILLVLVVAGFIWLGQNAAENLARQGVASGFAFLDQRAGFGIPQTLIPYSEDDSYGRVLLVGFLNTLLVAFLGIILASVIGFVVGVARLSSNWLIAKLATAYVELFRNIPLLLQLMFWYFGVLHNLPRPRQSLQFGETVFLNNRGLIFPSPLFETGAIWYGLAFILVALGFFGLRRWAHHQQDKTGIRPSIIKIFLPLVMIISGALWALIGLPFGLDYPALKGFNFKGGITIIPELMALLLALSLFTASFIAEIVRAGILSVDKGQSEAAQALGLPQAVILRKIIIPQALRVIIPPLTSQYLNLTKNSSLAVAIAYPDIVSVFAGTTLNQVGQAIEIIFITMIIYLSLSLITSALMNWYNARVALVGQAR